MFDIVHLICSLRIYWSVYTTMLMFTFPGSTSQSLASESSQLWRSLPEKERQKYIDEAKSSSGGLKKVNVKKECERIVNHLQDVVRAWTWVASMSITDLHKIQSQPLSGKARPSWLSQSAIESSHHSNPGTRRKRF